MKKKKTIKDFQNEFKNLVREMEKELDCPVSSVFLKTVVKSNYGNSSMIALAEKETVREIQCDINFGDEKAISFFC